MSTHNISFFWRNKKNNYCLLTKPMNKTFETAGYLELCCIDYCIFTLNIGIPFLTILVLKLKKKKKNSTC